MEEKLVKINNWANTTCLHFVRTLLSDENIRLMRTEYRLIDMLFNLEDVDIQGPTIGWLLKCGQVFQGNGPVDRVLGFTIGNKVFEFGPVECALMSGMNSGPYPPTTDEDSDLYRMFLTPNGKFKLTFGILGSKLNEVGTYLPDGVLARKLAVIYILYSMVFVKQLGNTISEIPIYLVNDPTRFNSFPWGRLLYDELVKEWDHGFQKRDVSPGSQVKIGTFPYIMQAWVFECLRADYTALLANPVDESPSPRVLRWKTIKGCDYKLAKQTFLERDDVVVSFIIIHYTPL